MKWLRSLLEDPKKAEAFLDHWRITVLRKPAKRFQRKPSDIPSRVFVLTALDTFTPPSDETSSLDLLVEAKRYVEGQNELPLGWGKDVPRWHSVPIPAWNAVPAKIMGLLITAFALSLGARSVWTSSARSRGCAPADLLQRATRKGQLSRGSRSGS